MVLSAVAVWGTFLLALRAESGVRIVAVLALIHLAALIAAAQVGGDLRSRLELVAAVALPALGTADLDERAAGTLGWWDTGMILLAAVLHLALCLEQAQRRRPRLEATSSEPSRPLLAPVRRARHRLVLVVLTGFVALVTLARAASLRSDASLASTWGDAGTGAAILVTSVPIVLGAHLALTVFATRFRRTPVSASSGAASRLVFWGVLAVGAATLLVLR